MLIENELAYVIQLSILFWTEKSIIWIYVDKVHDLIDDSVAFN